MIRGARIEGVTGAVVEQLHAACIHDKSAHKPLVFLNGSDVPPELVHVFNGGSTLVCDKHGESKHFSDYFSKFGTEGGEVKIIKHGDGREGGLVRLVHLVTSHLVEVMDAEPRVSEVSLVFIDLSHGCYQN